MKILVLLSSHVEKNWNNEIHQSSAVEPILPIGLMLLEELTANIRAAAEENASRGEGIALGIRRRCRRRGAACKSDRIRICTNQNCRTMTTPLWRRGPLGPQVNHL